MAFIIVLLFLKMQVTTKADASTSAHKASAAPTKKARQAASARQKAEKTQHEGPHQTGQQPRQAQQGGTAASFTPNAAPLARSSLGNSAALADIAALPPNETHATSGATSGTTWALLLQLALFADTCNGSQGL